MNFNLCVFVCIVSMYSYSSDPELLTCICISVLKNNNNNIFSAIIASGMRLSAFWVKMAKPIVVGTATVGRNKKTLGKQGVVQQSLALPTAKDLLYNGVIWALQQSQAGVFVYQA